MEHITTTEAARRLGVHPVTVRRMIARGALQATIETRPQGQRLRVTWDDTAHSAPHDAGTEPHGAAAPSPAPSALVPVAPAGDVAWLRARLEAAETGQAELRRLLLMEQQTVAALRALLPAALQQDDTPMEQEGTLAPSSTEQMHRATVRRSWWRRLFVFTEPL